MHYVEPRLVALYDLENPRGPDTDFYLDLANEIDARSIIDLGCGTGLLTREFATGVRRVTGVDPSAAMLEVARSKPNAERVTWVEGDASSFGDRDADLVVMTGNVAQVFLDESSWAGTLEAIHGALRPGGHLAFESRNPVARAWEQWTRESTFERAESPYGPMECWLELVSVSPGRVVFEGHNVFLSSGEVLVARSELRFRSQEELTRSLDRAGFVVEHVFGSWKRDPFSPGSRMMLFVARRS
ncbi:MAG: class I SAM-dependent methyltransferase [Candidatus Eisenbacteria bacterium]|uniref:Class I SAM-dependent methyltransferase n=1 Tax=Eiseniibacteriota bacterium TaxID=2212470 RepID=A0A956RNN8_UNCEI|nr:class I SAM-dependent methyltransferase [Candidatus Eisenbacteria bacterium]